MAFSIQVNPSAIIRTFDDAERFYNQFKPIRGRTKESTGAALCDRRDWGHKSLHKLNNGDTYGFRLYNTDVVQIHRDNSVTLDLSWPSISTDKWAQTFLRNITGRWIWVASGCQCVSMYDDLVPDEVMATYMFEVKESEQAKMLTFFTDNREFNLRPDRQNGWTKMYVDDPAPRYAKYVDKSAASTSRKPLQPFLNYLKVFESTPLPAEAIKELNQEFGDRFGFVTPVRALIDEPDNQELWPYVAAAFHTDRYDWFSRDRITSLAPIKDIKNELYDKKYTKDEIHYFVKLPIGVSKRTRLYTEQYVNDHSN